MRGLPTILSLFRDELNKFNNTGFYLLYDPKNTFKLRLKIVWNYALMLPYNYFSNHYGRHQIALPKFVNHKWYIDFNACRYITPMKITNK